MKKSSLFPFVQEVRTTWNLDVEVPDFDHLNGNDLAKYLFVLEAPGPKAIKAGHISFDNPDQTARNLKEQLANAGIERRDIAIWNVVPWYVGNEDRSKIRAVKGHEVSKGIEHLLKLLKLLPNLECVVLVGTAARRAHVALSAATTARILSCHHPSPRAMNLLPTAAVENAAVFQFMRTTSR
jgi:uracil-DNA glycosylase